MMRKIGISLRKSSKLIKLLLTSGLEGTSMNNFQYKPEGTRNIKEELLSET